MERNKWKAKKYNQKFVGTIKAFPIIHELN